VPPITPPKPWTRSRGMTASIGVLIVALITACLAVLNYFGVELDVDQAALSSVRDWTDILVPPLLLWLGRQGWVGRRDAHVLIEGSPEAEARKQSQREQLNAHLERLPKNTRNAKPTAAALGIALALCMPAALQSSGCGGSQAFAVQTSVSFETPKAGRVDVSVGVDLAGVSHVEVMLERVGDVEKFATAIARALGSPTSLGMGQSIELHLPDGSRALLAISLDPPRIRLEADNPRWARAALAGLDAGGLNLRDASPLPDIELEPEEPVLPPTPAPLPAPEDEEPPAAAAPWPRIQQLGQPRPLSRYEPGRSARSSGRAT
jgi:hypothetical protein